MGYIAATTLGVGFEAINIIPVTAPQCNGPVRAAATIQGLPLFHLNAWSERVAGSEQDLLPAFRLFGSTRYPPTSTHY